ncbi:MAG TPA: hypothetical protein PK280_10080 [Planctomycetota bacterium]|nr:hypothetical protein [Planctomycetota bacterium]
MSLLTHKPNAEAAIERLRALYARRAGDRIFAAFEVPSPALAEFKRSHAEGICGYPDPAERFRFWDRLLAERAALEDDSVPSAYLSEFDQGLYAGVLGAEVRFNCTPETGWISSMVAPLLADWADVGKLRLDSGHEWFRRYERQLGLFVNGARGRFGVSHFILIDGLNFAFELLGATETYLAMRERPEDLRRAVELGFQVNAEIQRRFFAAGPELAGGTCGFGVQWLPGRIVAESVDPFHMTSVEDFEAWGRGNCERIMAEFDGGVTHIHGNGRHLVEAVCSIQGLKAVMLGDDKGFLPAVDELPELRRRAGDMPLTAGVEFADFERRLGKHQLPGGVLYLVRGAASAEAANRCMEKVRAYRA